MIQNSKPELLMPAGSLQKMDWAFRFGADAVYAGVPILSLRARENEFDLESLAAGIQRAHKENKKFYLTANIFARNLKIKTFTQQLDEWAKLKPDAMIMADPGLIAIARERHPDVPVHLSVQANCMNWRAVQFWKEQGITRVILSRELRLTEIKEIRDRVPDIELEAFVHGSICIAYSGRCLLSHYMSHRDANQGVCDNSCRYNYRLHQQTDQQPMDAELLLQDMRDPKQFYPIEEDEHGTYIMNSKDLCLIEHLKEIRDAGVCSFKVEGRTKSEFYAAMISKIYRQAIDDMDEEREFDRSLLEQLNKLSSRGYHKGFMFGSRPDDQLYNSPSRTTSSHFAGIVHDAVNSDVVFFEPRSKLSVGDVVEFVTPGSSTEGQVLAIQDRSSRNLDSVSAGHSDFMKVQFTRRPEPWTLVLKK